MKQNAVATDLAVPNWPELAMKKVWPMMIKFQVFRLRVPDEWDGGLRTDRNFAWAILYSVSEEFVVELVKDCRAQRSARIKAK